MNKLKILFMLGCYWPHHEKYGASGANQSFEAIAAALSNEFEFKVISHDRRPGRTKTALKPEQQGRWIQCPDLQTLYLAGYFSGIKEIERILNETDYDLMVLNGFFDPGFTLPVLNLLYRKKIPQKPVILSPRGEFSPGALAIKAFKKQTYLALNRLLGFTRNVTLHATSHEEADFFRKVNQPCHDIAVAHVIAPYFEQPRVKKKMEQGTIKLVFISRISPKKNLDGALRILKKVQSRAVFDIYGPPDDGAYWQECQKLITALPEHITAIYKGFINNSEVPAMLAGYDLLFLPTHGENFGHVIHEAVMSGLPCLISDQTPWRNLERHGAGWNLPLNNPDAFARKIEEAARMSIEERRSLSDAARAYGEQRWAKQDAIGETRQMFLKATGHDVQFKHKVA